MLYLAATRYTYGVGSTPGNRTKKIGVFLSVSSNVSKMLKGGCSTYSSPIMSLTYIDRAEVTRSGRMARSSNSLWNLFKSLKVFGGYATSTLSSEYHFFH